MEQNNTIYKHFLATQQEIRKTGLGFVVSLVLVAFFLLCGYFYYTTLSDFNEENEKIKKNYMEFQKHLLKTRVDHAYSFIETLRQNSEKDTRDKLRARVYEAYAAATFIYEKYKNKEPESSIKQRIKDTLEKMRYEDGKSYVWIVDYDNNAVMAPNTKELEGTNIGYIRDDKGRYTVKEQTRVARTKKEGFLRDYFKKKGEDPKSSFPQISFVKDFGRFNWYFGSAIFLDDLEKKVQEQALDAVAKLRFDNNYIFIDTFDGYALLMNGEKLQKPKYIQGLTDKNGVKIIEEQLKAAKSSKEGGYVEYIWHEASLDKDMQHLSFCRTIDDWGWKIGTGVYVGKINDEIERRKELFKQKMLTDTIVIVLLLAIFMGISLLAAYLISKKMSSLFDAMNQQIESYSSELISLNRTLEQRVDEESQKRIFHEAMAAQQAKMAMVGEMMDAIAHQWKQPLNALAILVDDICLQREGGELGLEEMRIFKNDARSQIMFMSQTLNDFRDFFKPSKESEKIGLSSVMNGAVGIVLKDLKMCGISVLTEIDDSVYIMGHKNEIAQVVLNLISNAKDSIRQSGKKNAIIRIKGYKKDDKAAIEISDNGIGIDPALLPRRLFEHRVSTKGNLGSGIGLWMSALIVEKHGGRIRAENLEEGAMFEITMPAV